jgi:hypothetical protein
MNNKDILQNNNLYSHIQNYLSSLKDVTPLPKGGSATINHVGIYLHPEYDY